MTDSIEVCDVLIIGAGPCGLAVATRLREHTPSALFTDEEHMRYHWIKKHSRASMSIKKAKTGDISGPLRPPANPPIIHQPRILVLDNSGKEWLSRWNTLFGMLEISHLRSPMLWHVDPGDTDGLLSYVHDHGRDANADMVEIKGCVGKEISKHQVKKRRKGGRAPPDALINERDRRDYYRPSSDLFSSHCDCLAGRYGLKTDSLVQQESVADIVYSYATEESVEKVFTVSTASGRTFQARSVVLAVGPGNGPTVPHEPRSCHAMQIKHFPDALVASKIERKQPTSIVIIGGGLTSAQLADLAVKRGIRTVHLIMRGRVKVKQFDVGLEWMGKYKNVEQARFHALETDEERLERIKSARDGGSLTPTYHKILHAHVDSGRVVLHTHTTVNSRQYLDNSQTWTLSLSTGVSLPDIDYIYYATGIASDYATLPFLTSMQRDYPIHGHGGLPCLTDDLMWRDDVPLYVAGRLAGLRLGPAAGNLGGARIGAERIAWSLQERLAAKTGAEVAENAGSSALREDYASARGNRYLRLGTEDSDVEV